MATKTEGGVEILEGSTVSHVKMPETPPAPKGWVKLYSSSEMAVSYVRTSAPGVIDMVIAMLDNVIVLGSDGENKGKLKIAIAGLIGGQPFHGTVENELGSLLAELSA